MQHSYVPATPRYERVSESPIQDLDSVRYFDVNGSCRQRDAITTIALYVRSSIVSNRNQ